MPLVVKLVTTDKAVKGGLPEICSLCSMLCFWCSLTTSLVVRMSDTNCDRKRFVETLEHPRACQRGGSCGCYFYGRIHATKPATRGRKAEAINFYGYCLTNANAIIVSKPPLLLHSIFSPGFGGCNGMMAIDSNSWKCWD